jgi:hypothetical protein
MERRGRERKEKKDSFGSSKKEHYYDRMLRLELGKLL